MFSFVNSWIFLLLPLPWLLRFIIPRKHTPQPALRLPFYQTLSIDNKPVQTSSLSWFSWVLIVTIWLCLLTALARPQTLGEPVSQERAGRSIMMAIDISQSMALSDLQWSGREATRLQVVKALAGDFIDQREGDRIGLILFGSQAYLQTPLTFDRQTVNKQLNDATIGLAGKQTAIGDALGLGVKHLMEAPEDQRILVLLTDGVSNVGIDPMNAVDLAVKEKVKIYPIAFGHDNVMLQTAFGQQKFDLPLDETILKKIAELSGGKYFRAEDTQALKKVYQTLNKIEASKLDEQVFRPRHEWYPYPASIMFALLMILILKKLFCQFRKNHANHKLSVA